MSRDFITKAAIAALGALGALYVVRGLEAFVLHGTDLKMFSDQFYVFFARRSPYDMGLASSAYPPFAYLELLAFYWPAWPAVKIYFAAVTFAAFGYLVLWAYRLGAKHAPVTGVLFAGSVWAISSSSQGLTYGQNAILFTALLAGVFDLYESKRMFWAGLVLAIALCKINIAALFVVPFLIRKEWRLLAVAAGVPILATLAVAFWLGQSPIALTRAWLPITAWQACSGYGPAVFLCKWGVAPEIATAICEAVLLPLALAAMVTARRLPLLAQFGLAAGFGRLWTYHRVYDNFMLAFLLLALAIAYLESRNRIVGIAALAVGATLWMVPRLVDYDAVQAAQLAIWTCATLVLAFGSRPLRADVSSHAALSALAREGSIKS